MNPIRLFRSRLLPSLLATALLAACAGESPEAMLESARKYLAQNDSKSAVIQIKNALQQNPDLAEARYLLGRALLEGGDAVAAEVELRKAIALRHPADQTTPLLARALLQQAQYKKLIDELGGTRVASPEALAEVQTAVAVAQSSLGNAEGAAAALNSALATKPDHVPALLVQARMTAAKGDLSGATKIVDAVLARSPASADAFKLRGDLLLAKPDVENAAVAYRKAIEAKPDFVVAYSSLIAVLIGDNKLDEAARQIDQLKKIVPRHPMTAYLEARHAFARKDIGKARELTQQFLKGAPDHPLGLQLAGAVEYHAKAFPQAEAYFSKLVSRAPDSLDARRQLAMSLLRLGQPARAMHVLEPVLARIGQDSNMLALAGETAAQNGDMARAEQYFTRAAALDPQNAQKRTALALMHLAKGNESGYSELERIAATDTGTQADMALIASSVRRGQFDKALKAIDALERKQVGSPVPHQLRGGILMDKKDIAGARRSFERALAANPAYFPAAAALAAIDMAERKPDEAARRFESVLTNDPKSFQAIVALADLRARAGAAPDQIAALLAKAVSANPTEPAPRVALTEFHLRSKDQKMALASAQDAVAAIPDRPELLEVLGRVQLVSGDTNQALTTFAKMASAQPASAVPHLLAAEAHLAAKNRGAAIQSLRKALEITPDLIEAQRRLVVLNLESGAADQAVSVAREVQKQRPKEAVGYVLEGDVRAAKQSWKEAAEVFRAGLKVAPTSELAVKLHSALGFGGNPAEAQRFESTWVKGHPQDSAFRFYLGDRALAANDLAGAAAHYRAVIESHPNNAMALNNLAWISARQKNSKALEYAEKANRLMPGNPAFMDTLAMVWLEKGDAEKAVELLRKAAGIAPQLHAVRVNLARALVRSGDKAAARKELDALEKLGDQGPKKEVLEKIRKEL